MPGENLTRLEAEERAALVSDVEYDLALDLTRGPDVFGSTTTIRFRGTEGAATFVDALTVEVEAIRFNGRDLDPAVADGVRIALPPLAAENELTVVATMRYSRSGEGLHRFVDPADGRVYLYTQLATTDARRVFACFEQPDVKGRFAVEVTAPDGWDVRSNQPVAAQEPVGDGDRWWRFDRTRPLSTYLVALIAGPYVVHSSELTTADGRTIPLGLLTRASLAAHIDPEEWFEVTRGGFGFYEDAFGIPFPFDEYDQVAVPEYNWGAMENPGLVTFNEVFVFRSTPTEAQREERAMVVLHELAHMWFGDLVTMRWWDDTWLNESFATFMSFLATAETTRWTDSWATFTTTEKNWGYEQDQLPSTHPITADIASVEDIAVNFDGITYAKGGSVLKQLVAYVGRREFFAGVAAYLTENSWGNATLADLLAHVAAASGRDLAAWSAEWLETAGVNTLVPEIETDPKGVITRFVIAQAPALVGDPTLRPHRIAIGLYAPEGEDGALVRVQREELDVVGERTEVPVLVGRKRPAVVLLNDDDLAYAKVRLDPSSLAVAQHALSSVAAALPRTLLWSAIWDMTRDGEAAPSDFVRLVIDHVGAETSPALRGTLLKQVVVAAEEYVDPAIREATLESLADGLLRLLADAAPASDAQLQLARAFARVARSPEQLDRLADLDAGAAEGLPLDPDLRWDLLTGLVVGGRAGEEEIAALLAADDTTSGHEKALFARAAIPTAEAKAATWSRMFDSEELTNSQLESTVHGFVRTNDPTLLEPYVARYFERVESVWTARSFALAEPIALGAYPRPVASEALATAARTWLEEHAGAPAPLRRIVSENLSRTDRALAAQARDRA
ncbi:aminopeptidase N [Amnibacterium kyonggiense]|uniref:Aminopeptidase N n=1 Tax=Amnibacterium kyonggiense TaxID=595671 RepID=A0A4R7FRR2_9MICO|nr:aminopeptidase N [Amnibacterium kyonggiense]TDS80522.1 membrane alanyl aminopeptidase [Amnibacterium kyonggiense]